MSNPLFIPEIFREILGYLPGETLLFHIPLVCKEFNRGIKSLPESFWKQKIRSEIPFASCQHLFSEDFLALLRQKEENPSSFYKSSYISFVRQRVDLLKTMKVVGLEAPEDPDWFLKLPDYSPFLEDLWNDLPRSFLNSESNVKEPVLYEWSEELESIDYGDPEQWERFFREKFKAPFLVFPYSLAVARALLPESFEIPDAKKDHLGYMNEEAFSDNFSIPEASFFMIGEWYQGNEIFAFVHCNPLDPSYQDPALVSVVCGCHCSELYLGHFSFSQVLKFSVLARLFEDDDRTSLPEKLMAMEDPLLSGIAKRRDALEMHAHDCVKLALTLKNSDKLGLLKAALDAELQDKSLNLVEKDDMSFYVELISWISESLSVIRQPTKGVMNSFLESKGRDLPQVLTRLLGRCSFEWSS